MDIMKRFSGYMYFAVPILMIFCVVLFAENNHDPCASEKESADAAKRKLDRALEKERLANINRWGAGGAVVLRKSKADPVENQFDKQKKGDEFTRSLSEYDQAVADREAAQQEYDDADQAYKDCRKEYARCPGCGQLPAHMLHASCWNSGLGCSDTSVRECTHSCNWTTCKRVVNIITYYTYHYEGSQRITYTHRRPIYCGDGFNKNSNNAGDCEPGLAHVE